MALEVTLHDGDNGNYEIELKGQGSAGNDFGSGQDLVWSKVDDDQELKEGSFLSSTTTTTSSTTTSPMMSTTLTGPRATFEWNVVECSVATRKHGRKTILRNIVGRVESGSFTAILGPSGSGKTTLIDCLALRNRDFTGALRLDGHPLSGTFFTTAAYVHQSELFFTQMTAREHLLWHAMARMGGTLTQQQCRHRVEEVMADVNLTNCGDTLIGGGHFEFSKGLSGGERKRLAIATELLSGPSIMFLDEPTSGLDAVMGELICLLMSSLAQREPNQRIIMAALHTPSSRMYQMFTRVLVLTSGGQMAYHGPADKLVSFLEGLGNVCPHMFNPADFALELVSDKQLAVKSVTPMSHQLLEENTRHHAVVEACTRYTQQHINIIPPDDSHRTFKGVEGAATSGWLMFKLNLWRCWLQHARELLGLLVLTVMTSILGLIFGLFYYQQVEGSWRNTVGLLFSLVISIMIGATVQVCLIFPMDFKVVVREYFNGCNAPTPYFFGRSVASIPFTIIYLLQAIIPYWLTGLAPAWAPFSWFCLVIWLLILGAQSLGFLASSFSSNPFIGLALNPVLVTPMVLFSGFLYERNSVNAALGWIQDLSLANYAFGLLVINQCKEIQGSEILMNFLQVQESDRFVYLWSLVGLVVGFRLLSLLIIRTRIRYIKPL